MSFLSCCLGRRRLILAAVLLLSGAGLFSWLTMPREEDPQFPHRNAVILAPFPGADTEMVERLVVEPLEERLVEVEEVQHVFSTSRAGVAIVRVELAQTVYRTDEAWDDVQEAIDKAVRDLPQGVARPSLDHDQVSQEAVVLAVMGTSDRVRLAGVAEQVKRRLLALSTVKKIKIIADPGEQITVEYDDVTARRLGLDPRLLGLQLSARSAIMPGGLVHLGTKTANLRPQTEFTSLEELASTPVVLPSGASVELSQVATIRKGPREPQSERMRWNGEPAVGIGVIPLDGIDRVAFGEEVRELLAEMKRELEPFEVAEMLFQPDHVRSRLRQLSRSLLLGMFVVAAVLLIFMGPRLGAVVALIVPLVAFSSIALYSFGGGILHQISIAAVVIALGMLVDNAIVVAEAIQYRLDRGEPADQASELAVRELATPLLSATGTTLAVFVPMLMSKGNTADFTRALPVLIMLTLSMSYVFAVLVTPVLARIFLRARKNGGSSSRVPGVETLARLAIGHSGWVLISATVLVAVAGLAAGWVDRQFFPAADRSLVIVNLTLPEGTHLEETDRRSRILEEALSEQPEVSSVMAFVGRAAPHFYYNILSRPSSPHRAQLVVETGSLEAVEKVMSWTREFAGRELPEAEVVAKRLEQGPPVEAPVELRLFGYDLEELNDAADAVLALVRDLPGTRDVRHDLGLGTPTLRFEVDDAAAARHGVHRGDVALALLGRTLGQEVGRYRMGEDPIPIVVRSHEGENLSVDRLDTVDVAAPGGSPVPLAQVARVRVEWSPAAIYHRDGGRLATVRAQLESETTANEVLRAFEARRSELALPAGVRLEVGGEAEESGQANQAILRSMPIGILLLLFFLMVEFDSFRRVGIILVTVPLAATGVVPGLLISGQPFGFMSTLGIIALVGIVVNNAIVLLDVIERRRDDGATVDEAVVEAVHRRARPILLTTVTTVAGLMPLALSGTSLWPPLAWAMISGLLASTLLTLVVVPALYRVLLGGGATLSTPAMPVAGAIVVALVALSHPAQADPAITLTFEEALVRSAVAPVPMAAENRAESARQAAIAERRTALWPSLGLLAEREYRSEVFVLETPVGPFQLGEKTSDRLGVRLVQPIFDPVTLLHGSKAAREEAAAALLHADRVRRERQAQAAESFLSVLFIDARMTSTESFIESLEARLQEVQARVDAGSALRADALKIRLDLESARLDLERLVRSREVAAFDLGRVVGVDGSVEIEGGAPVHGVEVPPVDDLVAGALESRADLASLNASLNGMTERLAAVKAELIPRLEGEVLYSRSEGDPFRSEDSTSGMLRLVWTPLASRTRAPRVAALGAERSALEAEKQELLRGLELEIREALAQWEQAELAVAVRRRGVELAEETARVERERNRAGRSTTNDLLVAESTVRTQMTLFHLAELTVVRSRVALGLAIGDPLALIGAGG